MKNSKKNTNLQTFELFVSIGGTCMTRYQIDQFMSKVCQNYKAETYYFDWLMMGGVAGVTNVITRGFDIFPTMIEIYDGGGSFIPRDRLSGHTFLHDFGMGWWEQDRDLAYSRLQQTIEPTIEKYKYLATKTDNILKSNASVALVYHGVANDNEWTNLLNATFSRYGKKIPVINLIDLDQEKSKVDGILTAYVDNKNSPKRGTPIEWQGWDESWYQALSSFNLVTN